MPLALGLGLGVSFAQGAGGLDLESLADKGDLLIDFAQQSLTVGATTAYSNTIGSYTVARATQTHESQLTGTSDTLTATGWEAACTANTTPGSTRAMRYKVNFSPAINMSAVTNLVLELEYPQEMNTDDFGNGYFVGPRLIAESSGSNSSWTAATLWATQGIQKRRKFALYIPMGGALWTVAGGAGCNWSAVTTMYFYLYTQASNGGFRATLRKIWANRVGRKALVAFTYDDNMASTYTNALPVHQTHGVKAGMCVSSDYIDSGGSAMTLTQAQACYNAGWSAYNHMRSHSYTLVAELDPVTTAWSGGQFTVTVEPEAYADAVVGQLWEIRNSWGPEFSGTLELLSKGASNQLTFDCPTAPYLTAGSGYPPVRADWPGVTRAQHIANEVTPCQTYMATHGFVRGANVFVPPKGAWDTDWIADMKAAGFVFCRSTGNDYIASNTSPYYQLSGQIMIPDCFDRWDNVAIWLDNIADTTPNRDMLTGYVDTAIATGQFLHFMGHGCDATHSAFAIDVDLLNHLVAYVASKVAAGTVRVVTLEELAAALPDTTPDAFTFTDISDAALSTLYTSDSITVSGINAAASISVSGAGEYRIGAGSWTTTAGTITNGQTAQVRHTSSASNSTATSTTLTIGEVSDTYTTTTEAVSGLIDGNTYLFNVAAAGGYGSLGTAGRLEWLGGVDGIIESGTHGTKFRDYSGLSTRWTGGDGVTLPGTWTFANASELYSGSVGEQLSGTSGVGASIYRTNGSQVLKTSSAGTYGNDGRGDLGFDLDGPAGGHPHIYLSMVCLCVTPGPGWGNDGAAQNAQWKFFRGTGTWDVGDSSGTQGYCRINNASGGNWLKTGVSLAVNLPRINGGWHRLDFYLRQGTEGTQDGLVWLRSMRLSDGTTYTGEDATAETWQAGANPTDWLIFQHYRGNGTFTDPPYSASESHVYMDDVYISTSCARVEMTDNATYASSTKRVIQPINSWDDDGNIQITVNQGNFASLTGVHFHVFGPNDHDTPVGVYSP